jgi:REP element-mobilizing transposase RayT
MPDHVHLVARLPTTTSIADLVKQVKGASSHFANDKLKLAAQFKWQGSYGAFTVSRSNLDEVVAYVKRQKEHHANQQLWPDYEQTFEEIDPSQKDAD